MMWTWLTRLGSVRLAFVGMIALALGATLSYDNPAGTSMWVLVAPLALLAVNLLAAIITNPRINRRPGLLVFHVGLLGIIVLAGIGRLTHMDAHLEITQGTAFDIQSIHDVTKGPWHFGDLDEVNFIQGPYTVQYSAGMVRGLTHSNLLVRNDDGRWQERVIGDDRPLVKENYRFYTTFNKGFAPILTWVPDDGRPITGTVHMPSYPLFSFKQENTWTPPNGEEIKFWLRLNTGLREDAAWTLDGSQATGTLVVNSAGKRVELQPGDEVPVNGGTLRYEDLTTWMGYKIFYDPTLTPLFITAIITVIGLFVHFKQKFDAMSHQVNAPAAHQGTTTGPYAKLPRGRTV